MKALLFIIGVFVYNGCFAQFTGINKTNPSQPLDVNGNLNVDGKILLNNTFGQSGQVLKTNNTGATIWANLGDYPYAVNFTQNANFIVPAGTSGQTGGNGMVIIRY